MRLLSEAWPIAGLASCLMLAACGGRTALPAAGGAAAGDAAALPVAGGIPFPAARSGSDVTDTEQAGVEALQRSAGAVALGSKLVLTPAAAPQYAVYRFNLGGAQPDSVIAALDPALTAAAYIGCANFATQRWEFSGPYSGQVAVFQQRADYLSADGDSYVAVLAPAGKQAALDRMIQRFVRPGNLQPLASLQASATGGTAPLIVSFDASASSDPDGSIVEYAFDWEGDGVFDQASFAATAVHSYTTAGLYYARVRVRDNNSGQALAEQMIVVNAPPANQPPSAAFSFDPPQGAAPLLVTFDASASTDPDGSIALYEWDFDYDGVFEAYGQSPVNSHVYAAAGRHNAVLRVTDSSGAQATASAGWGISAPPHWSQVAPAGLANPAFVNYLPELVLAGGLPALAYYSGYSLQYARALAADGGNWSAPLQLSADCAGGAYRITLVGGYPAVAYCSTAGQLCYLAAQDAEGTAWNSPVIVGSIDPETTAMDISLAEVAGRPAIAVANGSNSTTYYRAASAAGSAWPAGETVAGSGRWPQLIDAGGCPLVCSVKPLGYGTYLGLSVCRGSDSDGTAWEAPQTVADHVSAFFALALVGGNPSVVYTGQQYQQLWLRRAQDAIGSAWDAPVLASPEQATYPQLATVDGLPLLVYQRPSSAGLPDVTRVCTALDPAGAGWSAPQFVGGGYSARLAASASQAWLLARQSGQWSVYLLH